MNPKLIFKLFSSNGIGQIVVQRQMSRLIMSLMALLLLAWTVYTPVAASEPVPAAPPIEAAVPAKVDPDRDIGLLEFFMPQMTKVVSTPDQLASPVTACTGNEAGGVLGREDGLLSLLGIGGQNSQVASLLEDGTLSLYSVRSGSANYIVFIKTECLGQLVAGPG